jgi:hypothetical protein
MTERPEITKKGHLLLTTMLGFDARFPNMNQTKHVRTPHAQITIIAND